MNKSKILNIIEKELKGLNCRVEIGKNYFGLDVWDESRELDENYILDVVEDCLYKISNELDEDKKEMFIDEICSDIWYSGFRNVKEEDLICYCDNKLKFECNFE